MKKLSIVLCGLRFGGAFVPIYRDHPDVASLGIFDPDRDQQQQVAKHFGISRTYQSFEDVLNDDTVDAVHLVTPIPDHEMHTIKVLESGKHCACTVPMAVTLEGLQRIIDACKSTGKKYMMMETTAYTRQYMMTKAMLDSGELGRVQFLRGSHYQDMENWPDYWLGLPPMHYATHAIAPMVLLANSPIEKVTCYGSGTMREALSAPYQNPFPVESALFRFQNGLAGEATRTLFETARTYLEGMYCYGSKASVEWGFADDDDPIVTRMQSAEVRGYQTLSETVAPPRYYKMLPESIQRYTVAADGYDETRPEDSLNDGAASGHHGSHPHLVHEFVRSIIEDRRPAIDERLGANITAAGICAHLSAMANGQPMDVPTFESR